MALVDFRERVFFKKSLYFPVGTVRSCILDYITVRFFLLLSGIVFYVFSELAVFRAYFSFLQRSFQLKHGDVGKCLHSPCFGYKVGTFNGIFLKNKKKYISAKPPGVALTSSSGVSHKHTHR